jgi:hypothetical protein
VTNIPPFDIMYLPDQVFCSSITLVTEEVNISLEEKYHYMNTLKSQIVKIPTLRLNQEVDNKTRGIGHTPEFKFKLMSEYPLHGVFWFFINKEYLQENTANIFWASDHFNYTISRIPNWYGIYTTAIDKYEIMLASMQFSDYIYFGVDVGNIRNPLFRYYIDEREGDAFSGLVTDVSISISNDITIEAPSNSSLNIGNATYFNYIQRLTKNVGFSNAPILMYIFDDNISQNYITSATNVSIMKGEKEYYVINKFGDYVYPLYGPVNTYLRDSVYVLYYYNIEYRQFNFQDGTMSITSPV